MDNTSPPVYKPLSLIMASELNSGEIRSSLCQVISLAHPMLIRQIRIPRSSTMIHIKHKKYENQFVENGFDITLYGLTASTNKYHLLFSDHINTDKSIREYVVPIRSDLEFTQLIFKGTYQKTLVVVYASEAVGSGHSPKDSKMDQNLEIQDEFGLHLESNEKVEVRSSEHEKGPIGVMDESGPLEHSPVDPLNNLTKISIFEPKHPPAFNLTVLSSSGFRINLRILQKSMLFSASEMTELEAKLHPPFDFKPNVSNINPSLFSEGDDSHNQESYELPEIEKLDQLGMYLKDLVSASSPPLSEEQLFIYFSTLTDSIDLVKKFIERRHSQMSRSHFFENNFIENSKISTDFCSIAKSSISGEVGGQIEQIMGLSLLSLLSNSEEHVKRLCEAEFFKRLIECVFSERIDNFRLTGLFFETFQNLVLHKTFRDALMSEAVENEIVKNKKIALKIKGFQRSVNRKEDFSKSHKKKKQLQTKQDEDSEGESSVHSHNRLKRDPKGDHQKNRDHDIVFRLFFNSMLTSDNYFRLKRLRKITQTMGLFHHLRTFRQTVKSMYSDGPKKPKFRIFEDNFHSLSRIGSILREMVRCQSEVNTDQLRIHEECRNSTKRIFNNQQNLRELMSESTRSKTKVVSCFLANCLKTEHYFDYLVLYLNHPELVHSVYFESTLQLVLRQLYFVVTCKGGISLVISEGQFVQTLLKLLSHLMDFDALFRLTLTESVFGQLFLQDVFVCSKVINESPDITKWLFDGSRSVQSRLAIMGGQFYYFLLNLNSGVSLMDKLSLCLSSWDNHQELPIVLCKIEKMFSKSCISRQSINIILREDYFFNILVLILKVDTLEVYKRMRFEIALVCRILCQFLSDDKFKTIARHSARLLKIVVNLEERTVEHSEAIVGSFRDATHTRLLSDLSTLKSVLSTFSKASEDFAGFLSTFQSSSRYTHTNIHTLISNKQPYSNVDREFPKSDPKKLISRLNDYVSFFKTSLQPNNKMTETLSSLKVLLFCLRSNDTLNQVFVTSNVFDVVNFLALVGENILVTLLGTSQSCREFQLVYQTHKNQLVLDFLDLFLLSFKVLVTKAVIKEKQDVFGKEYENVDLFNSILSLTEVFRGIFPNFFYELVLGELLETSELVHLDISSLKPNRTHYKLFSDYRSFFVGKESDCFEGFLSQFAKQKVQSLVRLFVDMIGLFSKFPGSYDTLLSELLFGIFTKPRHREAYFLSMALFINEPRKHKSREKTKRIIYSLMFEKVRTAKHSKQVLMQKYGCMKLDSMLDLHIIQNGYQTIIEYLVCTFLLATDPKLVHSFALLIVSLVEWKECMFCLSIAGIIKSVLRTTVKSLLRRLGMGELSVEDDERTVAEIKALVKRGGDPDRKTDVSGLIGEVGKIAQICQHLSLVCVSGTIKVSLLEDSFPSFLFIVLATQGMSEWTHDQRTQEAFGSFKSKALDLMCLFMNEDVGCQLLTKEEALDEKQYTDILSPKDLKRLIEFLGIELDLTNSLKGTLRSNSPDPTDGLESSTYDHFFKSLKLLRLVCKNPISKSYLCFGDYYRVIEDRHKSALDLKTLFNFIIRYSEDSTLEGSSESLKLNLNRHSAGRLSAVLEYYLQSAHWITRQTLEDTPTVHPHLLDALVTIFFKKKPVTSVVPKLTLIASKLSDHRVSPDTIVKLKLMVESLMVFHRKVTGEKQHIERFDFISEGTDIRTRLDNYLKRFYKYEGSLVTVFEKRGFADSAFNHLKIVLENKFMKISKLKNITRDVLLKCFREFLDFERCLISRRLFLPDEIEEHRHSVLGEWKSNHFA